jgi:hypothetical protein
MSESSSTAAESADKALDGDPATHARTKEAGGAG